jgi:DNA-binding NarL/FixJ family response regulator
MIRVLLVEDQLLVRRGIRTLLEMAGDIAVVADVGTADEGIAAIRQHRPDVVLLDVRMPGKSGIEVVRELRDSDELPPIILLTTFDDDDALIDGVKAGARGFLLKDISLELLTAAIRSVAAGENLIRPAITQNVLRGLDRIRPDSEDSEPNDSPERLTKRELDVLRLIAGGYSNREISAALGTVEGTVKNHASSILAKLGVRDRTRAVLKALELGYL